MSDLLEMGAEASMAAMASAPKGSTIGFIGNWTGGRLEAIGGLMKKHPILSTVAVLGGICAVGYFTGRNETMREENKELRATLKGVALVLNNLPNMEVTNGSEGDVPGGDSPPDEDQPASC